MGCVTRCVGCVTRSTRWSSTFPSLAGLPQVQQIHVPPLPSSPHSIPISAKVLPHVHPTYMWKSQHKPRQDNPYASKISYCLYFDEKAYHAGIGSPWYVIHRTFHYTSFPAYPCSFTHAHVRSVPGILMISVFKCMAALVNSVHRRGEPIKWGLVSYAPVMFLIVENAIDIHTRSISHTDNCESSGIEGEVSGGSIGY